MGLSAEGIGDWFDIRNHLGESIPKLFAESVPAFAAVLRRVSWIQHVSSRSGSRREIGICLHIAWNQLRDARRNAARHDSQG